MCGKEQMGGLIQMVDNDFFEDVRKRWEAENVALFQDCLEKAALTAVGAL